MNNFSKLLVLIILATGLSSIGWNNFSTGSSAGNITDYYYYQGQRYYLVHKPDMIYIKLKQEMPKAEFLSMISSFGEIPADFSYENNDIRQIVKLRSVRDNVTINNIINQVKNYPQVEIASPVFSMREGMGNSNTLIGCEDNIVAQFKPSYSIQQIQQYLQSKNMSIIKQLDLSGGLTYMISINTEDNLSSLDYANEVYSSGMVNYADPGMFQTNLLQFVPNDTYFPMQWSAINLGNNIPDGITGTVDNDMGLDSAWDQTTGISQCKVSIVDTGIDTLHEDLSGNIVHGLQYNYYANTPGGTDDYNHGTCCAGIVAAVGNNGMGISGVAPNAKIFSAKIFNSAGSTTNQAIIDGMIGVKTRGCWVSSNSWGGGSPIAAADNAILDGTVTGRNGKGIVWCFATGNGNGALSWPSTLTTVISVGGVSPCNQRKSTTSCDLENWWGANYGTGLDIVAPCVKIYATDRMGAPGYTTTNYFATFNGTSSATPNCSGVAALLLSKDSTQTWDTVRARINRTAKKRGSYSYTSAGPLGNLGNTWNNEMGYGIINANLALLAVGPPPANDVYTGPYLSFPASFTVNTAYNIRSRVTNGGTAGQTNVPMKYFVNGVQVGSTINIASLPPGASDSVTFPWTPVATGSYTLKIAHGLPVDVNRFNDTVTAVITVLPQGIVNQQTSICRNGLNKAILDNQTTFDTINVNIANAFNVIDVNVKIDTVIHTYDGDLMFTLSHLAGSSGIINRVGSGGDNFIGTMLNDSATTPIASGTAPFSAGPYIPSSPLSAFNGLAVNGQWVLSIADMAGADQGTLKAWCLIITYQTILGGIQTIEIPNYFSLGQNYPNPFNPSTSIKFSLPKAELVTLKVYDVLGKEVAVLVNEMKQPGFYDVNFNGSNLASGIYFYRIEAGEFTAVKKLMLVK